jgi:hypothetical protein
MYQNKHSKPKRTEWRRKGRPQVEEHLSIMQEDLGSIPSNTHTHTHTRTHTHTHTHTHAFSHTHMHACTLTHSHTHILTCSHSYSHTHSLSVTHTHTHTHTHIIHHFSEWILGTLRKRRKRLSSFENFRCCVLHRLFHWVSFHPYRVGISIL